jgi:hypothetical protein
VHKALLRLVILALTLSVVTSLGCRRSTVAASRRGGNSARAARTLGSMPADELTDTARVLAGLPPDPSSPLAKVAAKTEWQAWQREFDSQWTRATKERFARMSEWRDRELKPATGVCDTLMYPFAGPDILNALLLFPDCKRYILFGLEPVGSLPVLEQLPAERLTRLLEETRHALNDLLARNYFITSHMMKDTAAQELRGTLPLMAVSLVRMNARLVSVRDMEIAEDGQLRPRVPAPKDRRPASALELVFEQPGHERQTVVYFRAQAEDKAINQHPGVLPFLEQQAPFPTFLKSASYMLHGSDFSIVRNLLLQNSRLILEDDSGIPLRYLKGPEWTVSFYGKYDKPIKDFNYGYQADMAKVYSDPAAVKPLTFSFGYHWSDGEASVLLAVRNPSPTAR